jgi:hypothetical protein
MYKKLFFLISLVFVLGLAGNALAEPNLIAHYVFEGDFNDISGYFFPAPVGEPCCTTSIVYDADKDSNVVSLNGYNEWVNCGQTVHTALGPLFGNNITLACWVKDTGSNFSTGMVSNGYSWRLYCQQNTDIGLQINGLENASNDPCTYIFGTLGRLDGKWHHAAGVFDYNSLTMSLYVDGIPDGSVTAHHTGASFDLGNTYYKFYIGAQQGVVGREFDGLIDDVRIYNRALSHQEIRLLTGMDIGIAFAPTPFDPETNVGTNEILTWYPGMWAATHDVYFGTDYNDVNDATTSTPLGVLLSQGQTDPNYDPHVSDLPYGVFEPDTTYYWRVDEVNVSHPNTPWKGDIWRFTSTDGAASSPSPGDGADDVTAGSTLSWTAGDYAKLVNGHKVYFGTSLNPPLVAGQPQTATSYDPPGDLDLGTTYHWRVEEVNSPGPFAMPPGLVWSFTTREYLEPAVDDFEYYTTSGNSKAPDKIANIWKDGWKNGSNAEVFLEKDDPNLLHGGLQSMKYVYTNSGTPYYSEADANAGGGDYNLPVSPDWTASGVKALVLNFRGVAGNDANEQMYVRLSDAADSNAVVAYGDNGEDTDDLKTEEWQTWNIDLEDFNTAGVDLTNVNEMTIGFGDGNAPGGNGTVYFDDIRLYVPRCVPEKVIGDFTGGEADHYHVEVSPCVFRRIELLGGGDCVSDWEELEIMVDDWLDSDLSIYDLNGILVDPCWPSDNSQWQYDATRGSGTLVFDGNDDWVNIDDDVLKDFRNRTISVWSKRTATPTVDGRDIFGTDHEYRVYINLRIDNRLSARLGESEEFGISAVTTLGQWYHSALVVKDVAGGVCTGELFVDGASQGSPLLPQLRHSGPLLGANLGSYNNGTKDFLPGALDDLRIYDRVLTNAEITFLATDGVSGSDPGGAWLRYTFDEVAGLIANNTGSSKVQGVNFPITSLANLTDVGEPEGSRYVNFKDYDVMVDKWLEEIVWPSP